MDKSKIESLELPMSIIQRLIKDSFQNVSQNMIMNKEAKAAYQQISGYYILYIFSIANDISKEKKRQKVIAEDVYQALNEVGFDKYT